MFCKICNNLLVDICTADIFKYQCMQCSVIYEPTAEDTLRYDDIKDTNLIIYQTMLQNTNEDPVNNKAYADCKCGYKIVSQIRLNENMRIINTCLKCKAQWIEGS